MIKIYRQGCRQLLTSLAMLEQIAIHLLFLTGASEERIRDQIRWQEQSRKERFRLTRCRIINPVKLLAIWSRGIGHQLWSIAKAIIEQSEKEKERGRLGQYYQLRDELKAQIDREDDRQPREHRH